MEIMINAKVPADCSFCLYTIKQIFIKGQVHGMVKGMFCLLIKIRYTDSSRNAKHERNVEVYLLTTIEGKKSPSCKKGH